MLVKKYGDRVPGGAYEVFISDEDVVAMSKFGELQEQRDLERAGMYLRYFPNPTVDVTPTKVTDVTEPEPIVVSGQAIEIKRESE